MDIWMQRFLAGAVVVGFFGALGVLLFVPTLDDGVRDAVAILVGVLGAKFGTVYDYSFGSSHGSAVKEKFIEDLTKN